jgi:hypothetical protein
VYSVSRQVLDLPSAHVREGKLLVYGDTTQLSPVLMHFRDIFSHPTAKHFPVIVLECIWSTTDIYLKCT